MDEFKCKLRKPEFKTSTSSTSIFSYLFSPSFIILLILIGLGIFILVKQQTQHDQSSSSKTNAEESDVQIEAFINNNATFDDEEERKKKKKIVNNFSENKQDQNQEIIVEEKSQKIQVANGEEQFKKQKNVFNLVNLIANEISSIQVDNRQEKSIETNSIQINDQHEKHENYEEEQHEVVNETYNYESDSKRYSSYTENSELQDNQSNIVHSEVTIKTPSERIRQFSIKNDIVNREEDVVSSIIQEKRFINQTISENEEFIQSQQRFIQSEEIINTEAQGIRESREITLADNELEKHDEKEASLGEQCKIMGTSTNSLLNLFQVRHVNAIADNFNNLDEISYAIKTAGLRKSQLIFGIDFTISNLENGRKTFGGRSLHYIGNDIKNPYQKVIEILGKTLEKFDLDRKIPAYGFGDSMTKDRKVFKFSEKGHCTGFADVLACYNRVLQLIQLSGPTNFAPLIKEAINIVKQTKEYHILVIVADGQVTNARQTRDAIVEASKYPLSIIMVGVGDGPFNQMHEFDDSLPKRQFDNFQFVNYHEITENVDNPDEVFALNALMEIPDQYKAISDLGLLNIN